MGVARRNPLSGLERRRSRQRLFGEGNEVRGKGRTVSSFEDSLNSDMETEQSNVVCQNSCTFGVGESVCRLIGQDWQERKQDIQMDCIGDRLGGSLCHAKKFGILSLEITFILIQILLYPCLELYPWPPESSRSNGQIGIF